jgi:translocation and assembly module TamB
MASRRRRWLLALSGLVTAIALTLALLLVWLSSASGARWVLTHLDGWTNAVIVVHTPQGDPYGQFAAQAVTIRTATAIIDIQDLQWDVQDWRWWDRKITLRSLHAASVSVQLLPAPAAPPPTQLRLPVRLEIARFDLPHLQVTGTTTLALDDLTGALKLGADQHRIDLSSLRWQQLLIAGSLTAGTVAPIALTGQLTAKQASQNAELPDWRGVISLSGPLQQFDLRGNLQAAGQSLVWQTQIQAWAANPVPSLHADFENLDLAALIKSAPTTRLSGQATLQLQADRPLQMHLEARNTQAGRVDQGLLPIRSVQVDASEHSGIWTINAMNAQLLQGQMQGQGSWQNGPWQLELTGTDIGPEALDRRLPTGRIQAKLKATGVGVAQAFELSGNLTGRLRQNGKEQALTLTLLGQVDPRRSLELQAFDLSSGSAHLKGKLNATLQAAGEWRMAGELAASNLAPGAFWQAPAAQQAAWQASVLNGLAQFSGLLGPQGQLRAVQLQASLVDSRLAGQVLTGNLHLDTGALAAGQAWWQAHLQTKGQLQFAANDLQWDGALGTPSAQLEWKVAAPKLTTLQEVAGLFGHKIVLAGRLTGQGRFSGAGNTLTATASLAGSELRWADGSLDHLTLDLAAALNDDAPLHLDLALDGMQRSSVPGTEPSRVSKAKITVEGNWRKHSLNASVNGVARGKEFDAALALEGRGKNLLALVLPDGNATGGWDLQIAPWSLRVAGQPLLSVAPMQLAWSFDANKHAISASAGSAQWRNVPVRWNVAQWQAPRGDLAGARFSLSGELGPFAPLALRSLADTNALDAISGDLMLAGKFSVQRTDRFSADLDLVRVSGDLRNGDGGTAQALGLREMLLKLSANDGLWRLEHRIDGSNLGTLMAQVALRTQTDAWLPANDAQIDGNLKVDIANIAPWAALMPPGWRLGGSVNGDVKLSGTLAHPDAQGQLQARAVTVRNVLQGIDLRDGQGQAVLTQDGLRLVQVSVKAGSGQANVDGLVHLGLKPVAQLDFTADKFALLNRVDRKLTISGTARLDMAEGQTKVTGKLRADSGLIDVSRLDAPSLSDDVIVSRSLGAAPASVAARSAALQLDLTSDLGEQLRLRGRGLDTLLRGQLRLTTNTGRLNASGTVRVDGGTYAAYGQRLEIERGVLEFRERGALENPSLDILALRPNIDQRVGVAITGTALAPRIKLYAEPDLPDTEKLSWLVLGRGFDGLNRDDSALIQQAALALLAGENGGFTGQLQRKLGIDTFSVGSRGGDVRETVITVGKQISKRVYLGYERGLNSTAGNWQLIYRLSKGFTLRAQSGEDSAVDLIWTWLF